MSEAERRRHQERQQRQQQHQANQQIAASAAQEQLFGDDGADYLTESLKSKLDGAVRDSLQKFQSRDFPLANLTEEQEHQMWWELEILQDMIVWMHPREESALQGSTRAFVYDDPTATAEALTEQEKLQLIQEIKGLQSRLTRARGMKQQEINKTIRAESHTATEDTTAGSGGLLSRLRGR